MAACVVDIVLLTKKNLKLVLLLLTTIAVFFYILYSCHSTNSLVLTSFLYLTLFDIASLISCFVSKWISLQKPGVSYSYGYERGNVLAVFSSSVVVVLSAMTVVKHSMERLFDPPVIETEGMLLPVFMGVIAHLLATKLVTNKPMISATEGARNNFMQNALSDIGYSICGFSPALGQLLMQKVNPIALLVGMSTCVALVTKFLVDYEDLYIADIISTLFVSALVCGTLLPLTMYCARILLQTTPETVLALLDKSLKEVSTLDGVLECRNEHFWLVSFGNLTGSLHVRVRRDANEQEVLRRVATLMAPHVAHLTVQVTKDDWSLPMAPLGPKFPSGTSQTGSASLSAVLQPQEPALAPPMSAPLGPSNNYSSGQTVNQSNPSTFPPSLPPPSGTVSSGARSSGGGTSGGGYQPTSYVHPTTSDHASSIAGGRGTRGPAPTGASARPGPEEFGAAQNLPNYSSLGQFPTSEDPTSASGTSTSRSVTPLYQLTPSQQPFVPMEQNASISMNFPGFSSPSHTQGTTQSPILYGHVHSQQIGVHSHSPTPPTVNQSLSDTPTFGRTSSKSELFEV